MKPGLFRQGPDGMQNSALDGFAEHDVAGADRKPGPDEVADQVAQRIVGFVFVAELEGLVDAPEHRLRPLGGGAGVGIAVAKVLDEDFQAGFPVGEDLETGPAADPPFFFAQLLEVHGASEGGDGAE